MCVGCVFLFSFCFRSIYRLLPIAFWYNSKARFGSSPWANFIIICSSIQLWLGTLSTSLASGHHVCPQDLDGDVCVLISKVTVPTETVPKMSTSLKLHCRSFQDCRHRVGESHPQILSESGSPPKSWRPRMGLSGRSNCRYQNGHFDPPSRNDHFRTKWGGRLFSAQTPTFWRGGKRGGSKAQVSPQKHQNWYNFHARLNKIPLDFHLSPKNLPGHRFGK